MTTANRPHKELVAEIESLTLRLEEAEETLRAIGNGEVDAFVVTGPGGEQVFTLKGAEQPYRALVETMNEGAATLSAEGTILYCNKRLAAMLRIPLENIIGTMFVTYVDAPDKPLLSALLEKSADEPATGEITLISGEGNAVQVIVSSREFDLSGSRGITMIITDLTLQQRNDEIMAAGMLANSIIEQAGEAIVVCDEDGMIIRASRIAHQLCGVNPLLMSFDELLPLQRIATGSFFSAIPLMKSGESENSEVVFKRSDNQIFNLLLNATPLSTIQNRIFGCVVTLIDISERKRIEQELRDKNTELDRFTYTVSHDLKSPLITIQAYAGMIKKDLETGRYERAQDDMKRIEGATDKMTSLLNDLLELSRAGKIMNEPAPVDMNRLVKETLQQLTGPIAGSHVEIVLQPDLPSVLGDEKRIAEVVQNLIENAMKYMGDQAAPRIEIGTRQEDKGCVFFVNDNGKGIDPSHHEKIFGLFKKLDAESEGTGIGLALVKRIIEVHGGRVWVESEGEGMGSCFCFTLPGANV